MTFCEYIAIDDGWLTHWAGYNCDAEAWQQVCTGAEIVRAIMPVVPTKPLCAVCLASSEIEVNA